MVNLNAYKDCGALTKRSYYKHHNKHNNIMHSNKVCNKNYDIKNLFKIYHQNIRGMRGKINEFMIPLLDEAPNLICLTEHHLTNYEMDATHISKYKLGAKYCRNKLKNGGVCIYIQENLKFTTINLQKYCKEQDIEIAAIQIKLNNKKVIIFCVYRAPSGNYDYFLNKLD